MNEHIFSISNTPTVHLKLTQGLYIEAKDHWTKTWQSAFICSLKGDNVTVQFEDSRRLELNLSHPVDAGKIRQLGSELPESEQELLKAQEMKQMTDGLAELGLRIQAVRGDGNCMFRCFAYLLYGDETKHEHVRKRCYVHMEEHGDYFSRFIEGEFASYVANMRVAGSMKWGDHVELVCMQELFAHRVEVYDVRHLSTPLAVFTLPGTETAPALKLSYHGGIHYNAVVDLEAKFPLGDGKDGQFDFIALRKRFQAEDQVQIDKAKKEAESSNGEEKHEGESQSTSSLSNLNAIQADGERKGDTSARRSQNSSVDMSEVDLFAGVEEEERPSQGTQPTQSAPKQSEEPSAAVKSLQSKPMTYKYLKEFKTAKQGVLSFGKPASTNCSFKPSKSSAKVSKATSKVQNAAKAKQSNLASMMTKAAVPSKTTPETQKQDYSQWTPETQTAPSEPVIGVDQKPQNTTQGQESLSTTLGEREDELSAEEVEEGEHEEDSEDGNGSDGSASEDEDKDYEEMPLLRTLQSEANDQNEGEDDENEDGEDETAQTNSMIQDVASDDGEGEDSDGSGILDMDLRGEGHAALVQLTQASQQERGDSFSIDTEGQVVTHQKQKKVIPDLPPNPRFLSLLDRIKQRADQVVLSAKDSNSVSLTTLSAEPASTAPGKLESTSNKPPQQSGKAKDRLCSSSRSGNKTNKHLHAQKANSLEVLFAERSRIKRKQLPTALAGLRSKPQSKQKTHANGKRSKVLMAMASKKAGAFITLPSINPNLRKKAVVQEEEEEDVFFDFDTPLATLAELPVLLLAPPKNELSVKLNALVSTETATEPVTSFPSSTTTTTTVLEQVNSAEFVKRDQEADRLIDSLLDGLDGLDDPKPEDSAKLSWVQQAKKRAPLRLPAESQLEEGMEEEALTETQFDEDRRAMLFGEERDGAEAQVRQVEDTQAELEGLEPDFSLRLSQSQADESLSQDETSLPVAVAAMEACVEPSVKDPAEGTKGPQAAAQGQEELLDEQALVLALETVEQSQQNRANSNVSIKNSNTEGETASSVSSKSNGDLAQASMQPFTDALHESVSSNTSQPTQSTLALRPSATSSSSFESDLFLSSTKRQRTDHDDNYHNTNNDLPLTPDPQNQPPHSNLLSLPDNQATGMSSEHLISPSSDASSSSGSSSFAPSSAEDGTGIRRCMPVLTDSPASASGFNSDTQLSPNAACSTPNSDSTPGKAECKRASGKAALFLEMDAEEEDGGSEDEQGNEDEGAQADAMLEADMADLLDESVVPANEERQAEALHSMALAEDDEEIAKLASRFVPRNAAVPDFMKLALRNSQHDSSPTYAAQPSRRRKRSQVDDSLLASFDTITKSHFTDSDSEEMDEEALKKYQERVRLKYMNRTDSLSMSGFEHDQKSQHLLSKVQRDHPVRLKRTNSLKNMNSTAGSGGQAQGISFASFNETLQTTRLQRQHSVLSCWGSKDRERIRAASFVKVPANKKSKSFIFTWDASRDSFPSAPSAMSAPKLQRSKSLNIDPVRARSSSNQSTGSSASGMKKCKQSSCGTFPPKGGKSATGKGTAGKDTISLKGGLFAALAANRFQKAKTKR